MTSTKDIIPRNPVTGEIEEVEEVPHPGEPLKKVTLNLYEKDVHWLQQNIGEGWSTHIRDTIQREVNHLKQMQGVVE